MYRTIVFGHHKCSGGYRVHIGSPEAVPGTPGKRYGPNGPRGGTQQPAGAAPPPSFYSLFPFLDSYSYYLEGEGGNPTPGGSRTPHLAHAALWGRWPHLVDPRDPPGGPGTLPIAPETFTVTKTGLPIYKSLPPDHSGNPRDVRDLIRDSEKHSGFRIHISLQP